MQHATSSATARAAHAYSAVERLGYAWPMTPSPASSPAASARRRWRRGGIAVIAAATVLLLLWQRWQVPRVDVVRVSAAPVQQQVVATGRVATVSRVQVGSEVSGVVLERRVNEGDRVQPGEVLAVLRAEDLEANLRQAQAVLDTLQQSRRPQAQATLDQAEAQLAQAEREALRRGELASRQLVAREDYEQARQAVVSARANAQQARLALAALAGGPEQAQAVANVAAARAALDKASVRATVAGTVLTRDVEPGDLVQPGSVLLSIASDGATELRVPVDEKNLQVLQLGQPAQAVADAFPDRPFPATVSYIAPSVDSSRGSIEIRLTVDPVPQFLRQDLTVSVNVLTGQKPQALVVPNDALHPGTDGSMQLWLVRDGRLARVPVELGLRGTQASEVVAGVAAGETVVVGEVAGLQPGQRVRSRLQQRATGDGRSADAD